MQDSGSLAVFKVTARDQGHYKGPSGAFLHTVTFLVFVLILVSVINIFVFKYNLHENISSDV